MVAHGEQCIEPPTPALVTQSGHFFASDLINRQEFRTPQMLIAKVTNGNELFEFDVAVIASCSSVVSSIVPISHVEPRQYEHERQRKYGAFLYVPEPHH